MAEPGPKWLGQEWLGQEWQAQCALQVAFEFLGRWQDGFTRSLREELSQEVAICALGRFGTLRDPRKFGAFVRTIARRKRAKMSIHSRRIRTLSIDVGSELREVVPAREPEEESLQVGANWVEKDLLLIELGQVLKKLTQLNSHLLLSYYEGFSCAELAERYGMPVESVKVRLHRSRRRVRTACVSRVASASISHG